VIDNAVLGCKNAVKFYRTSVVEYLLGVFLASPVNESQKKLPIT